MLSLLAGLNYYYGCDRGYHISGCNNTKKHRCLRSFAVESSGNRSPPDLPGLPDLPVGMQVPVCCGVRSVSHLSTDFGVSQFTCTRVSCMCTRARADSRRLSRLETASDCVLPAGVCSWLRVLHLSGHRHGLARGVARIRVSLVVAHRKGMRQSRSPRRKVHNVFCDPLRRSLEIRPSAAPDRGWRLGLAPPPPRHAQRACSVRPWLPMRAALKEAWPEPSWPAPVAQVRMRAHGLLRFSALSHRFACVIQLACSLASAQKTAFGCKPASVHP